MFLVGDPYKPSFATVTGRGDNPNDTILSGDFHQPNRISCLTFIGGSDQP